MRVGIPREVKNHAYRVAISPQASRGSGVRIEIDTSVTKRGKAAQVFLRLRTVTVVEGDQGDFQEQLVASC